MEDHNKRAEAWTHEETVLLIELWGDEKVQNELENTPRRNLEVFRRICTDMKDRILDFSRSPQDCRGRIKRLKTKYFQVKRQNKKSGGKRRSFPYHERMDTILGTRPSVNPVALSDSLISLDDTSDNEGENYSYEAIADTELEDDDDSHTSDVSRQPESQLPGPPRPETPAPSRPGSAGMQTSRDYNDNEEQQEDNKEIEDGESDSTESYDLNEEEGDESKDFIDDEDKDYIDDGDEDFIDDEEASSENENEDFSDDEDSVYS